MIYKVYTFERQNRFIMLSKIVYTAIAFMSLLPFRVLYFFSDSFYLILYHLLRYRRKVVRENLTNAFPTYSITSIVEIEKAYYRHMCDLFVETYKMLGMSEKEMKQRCRFKNMEMVSHFFAKQKSVIGVMGHYGNWEWLSSCALWADPVSEANIDVTPLYKPIHNKAIDDLMLKIRRRFKGNPIPKQDVLRYMVQKRSKKELFFAAFIADQTPNRQNLNFWMQFLNQETPIFLGTERIATKFNLPVISVKVTKPKRGFYEVEFILLTEEPIKLQPGELTRIHTQMLEKQIKERPELWLWSHRRWKYKPNEVKHE